MLSVPALRILVHFLTVQPPLVLEPNLLLLSSFILVTQLPSLWKHSREPSYTKASTWLGLDRTEAAHASHKADIFSWTLHASVLYTVCHSLALLLGILNVGSLRLSVALSLSKVFITKAATVSFDRFLITVYLSIIPYYQYLYPATYHHDLFCFLRLTNGGKQRFNGVSRRIFIRAGRVGCCLDLPTGA